MRFGLLSVVMLLVVGCSGPSGNDAGSPGGGSAAGGGSVGGGSGGGGGGSVGGGGGSDLDAGMDAGVIGGGSGGGAADGGMTVTVRVHYPVVPGHTISIRGDQKPLDWNHGIALPGAGNAVWTWSSCCYDQPLEVKPLLDDATWSRGPNYVVQPGGSIDVYPHFTVTQGTWSRAWPTFHSTVLNNDRGVWLYLPPTYVENNLSSFGVVYMHDGQNLFDPNAAFGHNPWKVQDAVDAAAESGAFEEVIVVGPENTADRIPEYTPTLDPQYGGGDGDAYLAMLVEELKPVVDGELRTKPDREHTAILGSSLGGLISGYAGITSAGTFGLVGLMSPSSWWDNEVFVNTLLPMEPLIPRPIRVYVDSGDSGTDDDDVTLTAKVAQEYRNLGYVDDTTLKYVVQAGGQHNETYWRQRLPGALTFLIGPPANR